jgi:type I restriction enzyme S subunit
VRLSRERTKDPDADGFDRYVGLDHIDPGSLKIRRWGDVADGTTFTNVFRPGQVLFGKRRAYQRKIAIADFTGVCSGDIYVLESKDPSELLPELVPFICSTEEFFDHAVSTSAGSLSPRTNWNSLSSFEFVLPSLKEQKRIVAAVSAIIRYQDSLIAIGSALSRSVKSMRAEFFDPSRLSAKRLADYCDGGRGIKIGPFGAQLHQSDYITDGVPVVMPVNMRGDRIDRDGISTISESKARELQVHRLQPGDILLPRRGELDRRAFVTSAEDGWICGTGSLRIRVADNSIPSVALLHALASVHSVQWLLSKSVGTTMPNLNSTIVSQIPVAIPDNNLESILACLDELENARTSVSVRTKNARRLLRELSRRALGMS